MTQTQIAKEIRRCVGGPFITAAQFAQFIGDKNVSRARRKYLQDLEAIDGKRYLISEVAERLKNSCRL